MEVTRNNRNKIIKDDIIRKVRGLIKETNQLKQLSDRVNKVKNFLLFNAIYYQISGKDENIHFDKAYNILDNIGVLLRNKIDIIKFNNKYQYIVNIIKKNLFNNEKRTQEFIKNFIVYYNINDENLIDELTKLFKSKKYEFDIKSIIFFFEYFQKDNKKWNDILLLSWENFKEIKKNLNILKENGIYDYKNVGYYNELFTCLYDKKEAIDFLFSKTIMRFLN